MPSTDQNLLERLSAEIETAWEKRQDIQTLHRLAELHPELAGDLYNFFAILTAANDDSDLPQDLVARAVARTRKWLEDGAYQRTIDATRADRQQCAPTTTYTRPLPTLIGFLQRRTNQPPGEIATKIPHASVEFLQTLRIRRLYRLITPEAPEH